MHIDCSYCDSVLVLDKPCVLLNVGMLYRFNIFDLTQESKEDEPGIKSAAEKSKDSFSVEYLILIETFV